MEKIQELIKRVIPPENNLSVKEVLESYSDIELTEEEMDVAILQAKVKKRNQQEYDAQQLRIAENRRVLTQTRFDYSQTKHFFQYRAQELFKGAFHIDESNAFVFELLCKYFSDDTDFVSMATTAGIMNPKLDKGILLAGTFGTGKTWMMRLMQKNRKNCYLLKNAKEISNEFEADGTEAMSQYETTRKNAINDAAMFFQTHSGLCIDDLGTEEVKNNYGNKRNVIGDLFEMRYNVQSTGIYLHATTNLSADGLASFYGPRITSRMREIFNIIELKGNDRRK